MATRFEAYTADGVVRAHVAGEGRLGELLESEASLVLEMGRLAWLDGSPPISWMRQTLRTDDLLVVVAPDDQLIPTHAVWHDLRLLAGPYAISGLLPTLPGFDPGRAISRPSGTFILLADVGIGPAGSDPAATSHHAHAWVNRFAVERVEADLELGFFFSGAESEIRAAGGA